MMGKLIKGVTVEMGGEEWVIPPLTLGAIEDMQEELSALATLDPKAQFAAMATVIHTAMQRNYPDLTLDRLKRDLLDMGNIFEVTDAVMGASGMVKKLGERMAGRLQTGATSTQE